MTVRRLLATLVLTVGVLALAGPVAAQEPNATTTIPPGAEAPNIIPKPNSGAAPQEAGDRGGALQLGVLALLLVAVGGVVLVLVRQSRRARAGGG